MMLSAPGQQRQCFCAAAKAQAQRLADRRSRWFPMVVSYGGFLNMSKNGGNYLQIIEIQGFYSIFSY